MSLRSPSGLSLLASLLVMFTSIPLSAVERPKASRTRPRVELPTLPGNRTPGSLELEGAEGPTDPEDEPWFTWMGPIPPTVIPPAPSYEPAPQRPLPYGTASLGYRFTHAFGVKAVFRNSSHNGIGDGQVPEDTPENIIKRQTTGGILLSASFRF